jgi:HSP20 family protein
MPGGIIPMTTTTEKKVPTTIEKKETKEEGVLRRKPFFPFLSLTPRDFFTLSPFEMMKRFSEEMDNVFGGYGLWRGSVPIEKEVWTPAIEVFEKDNKFFVRAELPGLVKEDVKVELTDDYLIIKGERKNEKEEKGEGFYRTELSYGKFYRSVPIPEFANLEETQATFNNGVLEVSIPIPEAARKRREIPVEETKAQAQTAAKG